MTEITDSGHLAGAHWEGGVLTIRFRDGKEYDYYDVPQAKYHELLEAGSKSQYFRSEIKDLHECSRR